MKITFYSNFINHHQIPLCESFINKVGKDNFLFVATEPVPEERINMGYPNDNKKFPYVLTTYDSSKNFEKAMELSIVSDIVIIGSAPDTFIVKRLKRNMITFRYCERYFRYGWNLKHIPRYFASSMLHHKRFEKKPLYYLCSSAYTAGDVNTFANYEGRTFKWGYFPVVNEYDIEELLESKRANCSVSILWAGRLLKWKHPDVSILVAKKLKEAGFQFELNIIGDGSESNALKEMVRSLQLDDCVHMLGSKSPDIVRQYMEKANVYLFTSDYQEGWGAVLNEAMNSACAVVASHAVGSVPFLIDDNNNGIIYKSGDTQDLYERVSYLINNPNEMYRLGRNAYETLFTLWNADVAADRLIQLYNNLLNGSEIVFNNGPCSEARSIKQDQMFELISKRG